MRLWAFRLAVWGLCLGVLGRLVWLGFDTGLGPNPVEFIEHYTGEWALRLLLASLAMTPLRQWLGWVEPIRVRRLLGLWAFAFVCLHFAAYLVFDLSLSLPQLGEDLLKRTYITLGFAAWLLLLPLAITSTQGWQRRLKRRWKQLHRAVYAAGILGALHFVWLVKADLREPLIYCAILALLLAWRVPWRRLARLRRQPGLASKQTGTS